MSGRPVFEHELEQLNVELVKMGALIEQAIENSVIALKNKDVSIAKKTIEKDRVIDDMEKIIESKCLSIILRQQPVAKDLRIVSTALKMVTDMERIGDHAADISELVLRLDGDYVFNVVEHIPAMSEVVIRMLHEAISAFINGDIEAAVEIKKQDDEVDELFNKVKTEVVEILKKSSENIDMCIDFLMIAKYFERIGDHAENICEWTEFLKTGEYKNQRIL